MTVKAIMVTFDSLNRRMLPGYGNEWVQAEAFASLAEWCTTYDQCYVGSMPCMPARRELHAGRENFLHCPWSPLEPFDDSIFEMLGGHGVYTHLVTDHVHYWEDAGFAYHNRYTSYRFSRGQEGDPVYGDVDLYTLEKQFEGRRVPRLRAQDVVNRHQVQATEDFPQAKTFAHGLEFLERNHAKDHWLLHIETFDPHEPFFAPEEFRKLYGLKGTPTCDWPDYAPVEGNEALVDQIRLENAALVSFCDHNLGKVLDAMDAYGLWEDTMLIVNTDHGFLLGEHGWFGKNVCPYYNEVAQIPLFVHVPGKQPTRDGRLVQTVDIPLTLLDYFGVSPTKDMTGHSLLRPPARDFGIFGIFGGLLNMTDGRYLLMRQPDPEATIFCYTMGGLHFGRGVIQGSEPGYRLALGPAFSFTKGYPLLQVEDLCGDFATHQTKWESMLFDLEADPKQLAPFRDAAIEARLLASAGEVFRQLDAPGELYGAYSVP